MEDFTKDPTEMEWNFRQDQPQQAKPRPVRMPVQPKRKRGTGAWGPGVAALACVVLLLSLGWCSGSAAGRRYVREADLAVNEFETRALAAEDAAAYWESEAASATAGYQAMEADVADLAASVQQWQLYAEEASKTISTLKGQVQPQANKQPAATPQAKVVQAAWTGSVEQWRPLAEKYFGPLGGNRVEEALLCISIETGGTGNPNADTNPPYVGLFQMDAGWGTDAQRRDPEYVFACAANSVATHGSWKRWPPMVDRGY